MAIWIVLLPSLVLLRNGLVDGLPLVLLCVMLIPAAIFAMYLHRLLLYVIWRFYWHINTYLLTCATVFYLAIFVLILFGGASIPESLRPDPLVIPGDTISNGLIVLAIAVPLFLLYRRGRRLIPAETDEKFVFSEADDTAPRQLTDDELDAKFRQQVADVINEKTSYTARLADKQTDIDVFKDSHHLIGLVRCKRHQPGRAIAPLFIHELKRVKDATGLKFVYLVTNGSFTEEARQEAEQVGIRLMDGRSLVKQLQG